MEFYRWWSIVGVELKPGKQTLTVSLDPSRWSSVNGKRGDISEDTLAGFVLAPDESDSPMPRSQQPTLDGAQALTSREFRVQKLRPLFGAGSCGI
jgi:hypothetical protein